MAEGLSPSEGRGSGGPAAGGAVEAGTRRAVPRPVEIYDPVARALDVIGDRWSLVLVRHLLLGPKGFSELRMRTGIAPRVLSSRLRDLAANGFVENAGDGARSPYRLTARGRTLEPIVAAVARWFTMEGARALDMDGSRFTETSPQSILESLPFLLREEQARAAHRVYEIRLTGEGGGVWCVRIDDGQCRVLPGFAERADVRYTADAKAWCAVALGLLDGREAARQGLLVREGAGRALDHFFHQIYHPGRQGASGEFESRSSSGPKKE